MFTNLDSLIPEKKLHHIFVDVEVDEIRYLSILAQVEKVPYSCVKTALPSVTQVYVHIKDGDVILIY